MGKLNDLFREVKPGRPVTSEELSALGVSADLAVHYVRAGWLTRLARGVYARPDTPLELYPSLQLLERRLEGLHVGGKTALDWHGVRHNLAQRPQLQLYGWASGSLPTWFTERFPASYHRLRLFDEPPDAPLRVSRFQHRSDGPLVSEPEGLSWSCCATSGFANRSRKRATFSKERHRCERPFCRSCCDAGRSRPFGSA